ncbi:MAG: HAD-IIIA family hydrolase [bacterium]|jgi:histidinol-phosphate phosphatase family protein
MTDSNKALFKSDKTWTLFLDRDGVINQRPPNDYVKDWAEFIFLPGVLEAMPLLTKNLRYIIVVTNQQGIGKNLMRVDDLMDIHNRMKDEIRRAGGHVDAIYFCPDLATKSANCRKPGLTMARLAQTDFPDINFEKSIMVGDTVTDMQFGKAAGMLTILVGNPDESIPSGMADLRFDSLLEFAKSLVAND